MATPAGSSASVRIVITISTIFGSSTDDDTKIVTTTGTAHAAFAPNATPFTGAQFNTMHVAFSNTTFAFTHCLPLLGCQNSNVSLTDLQMTLVEPVCSSIAAGGAVAYPSAIVHMTGSYIITGIAPASGIIDDSGSGGLTGRITNPLPATVQLDQLAIADQTISLDPATLPPGITAITVVVQPNLANTTFAGPFAPSAINYDADNDGQLNACDACTDADGDGFGDPGFIHNTCTLDNCPDVFNPDQTDSNSNGIGDACERPVCAADLTGDAIVNVADLLSVIGSWGACGLPCPPRCAGDVTGDCTVNVSDMLLVIGSWGACP